MFPKNRLRDLPFSPDSSSAISSENSSLKGSIEALNAADDTIPLTLHLGSSRGMTPEPSEPRTPIVEIPASPNHSIHSIASDPTTNSHAPTGKKTLRIMDIGEDVSTSGCHYLIMNPGGPRKSPFAS